MRRSESNDDLRGAGSIPFPTSGAALADGPPDATPPPERIESWDPADDEKGSEVRRSVEWDWHGRRSWGRRAVASFPFVAVFLAVGLVAHTTLSAQGAIDQVTSVKGSGGATLLSKAPAVDSSGYSGGAGSLSDYQGVTFTEPSSGSRPIQGSASQALVPYAGWESNGSAGAANGWTAVSNGQLHVGIGRATPDFRGWFLTTTGTIPASCAFQFSAASPPPVTATAPRSVGELVMAVQTGSTVTTGDIDYVVVAENVAPTGLRTLIVGYSLGRLSSATEHILKQVLWKPGPLQAAVLTNGDSQLSVWIDGSLFYSADDLHLGIAPPFQAYLEVQARRTAYTASFNGYSSVCQPDILITNLPDGSTVQLGSEKATARDGTATLRYAITSAPVAAAMIVSVPGESRPIRFDTSTYWPGSRYSFAPGV